MISLKARRRMISKCCLRMALGSSALLLPSIGSAQIANVSDAANRQVVEGLSAKGELSWEKKTGNNEVSILSAGATGYLKQGPHLTMLILRREYGKQRSVLSSDSTFEHLRHRYTVSERLAAEAFVQQDRDPFRRIGSRFVAGAGPRVLLYTDPAQNLYLSVAPMYERERIDRAAVGSSEKLETERARLSVNVAYDLKIDERLSFHNIGYYQPVLTAFKNRRLLDEASLTIKIAKHLDFKLTAAVAHDSLPPVGIKEFDQQYKNSLVFEF